ncbi:MAG: hypothetical protein ACRBBP_10290 [Bdellovibrionales bacterium]
MSKNFLKFIIPISVLALFIIKANTETYSTQDLGEESKVSLSSIVDKQEKKNSLAKEKLSNTNQESPLLKQNLDFISSPNFKTYHNIMEKVVRSPEDKLKFSKSLKDAPTLQATSRYLISPEHKISKETQVKHLKASAFIIEALTLHPQNQDVLLAVQEILDVNLSSAKASLSKQAYQVLQENKAEIMYHALALIDDLQDSYTPESLDTESQRIHSNVIDLHESNKKISYNMIAENR